ncbi:hypothetical protein TNCV_3415751 [Trichonephila clavipes]|nr:hypothetical protein TNCV_3415751 [Trichonephila clavipes]
MSQISRIFKQGPTEKIWTSTVAQFELGRQWSEATMSTDYDWLQRTPGKFNIEKEGYLKVSDYVRNWDFKRIKGYFP